MTIGERIKARRKELGYSAERLAELAGLSPATIYRYESLDIASMRTDKLRPIAAALSTTPDALMGWQDADFLRSEFTLRMEDDSMSPRILPGDLVFLRRQADIQDGETAAVEMNGPTLLRRIYRIPHAIQLIADNPAYPPMLLPDDENIEITGRAVALRRNL